MGFGTIFQKCPKVLKPEVADRLLQIGRRTYRQNPITDTQKETEKTTQKVTTQQKEETNVTTVVISDEKCVNATIKRTKIKKIKKPY